SPLRQDGEAAADSDVPGSRGQVFISYSRNDIEYVQLIKEGLAPLRLKYDIEVRTDEDIPPGAMWENHLDGTIEKSTVGICLISDRFLASQFIMKKELPALLRSAQNGQLSLIPVRVGPVSQSIVPAELQRFQFIPSVRSLEELEPGQRKKALVPLFEQVTKI